MRNLLITALVVATMIFSSPSVKDAHAQASDMWEGQAAKLNLFTPHENYCDSSTEAFVTINGFSQGFCIEKSERSAALYEDAKQTCSTVGKRLPEPTEYKYCCNNAGSLSLSNMTNDAEWVSNQAHHFSWVGQGDSVVVPTMGNGSCAQGAYGVIASNFQSVYTLTYRCLR